jgi:hypothetical protein
MRKVHSFTPATDDWFVLHHTEDKRWAIERVVAWGLLQADEEQVDTLEAFLGQGLIADFEDYAYVKGTDRSPVGRRWGEIYETIAPDGRNFREITDPELLAKLT